MVALRRPDRLCEIDLHVTSSMLASIVEVTQKPCQALESIRITVEAPTGTIYTSPEYIFGWFCPASERNQAGWCCLSLPGNTTSSFIHQESRRASPWPYPE